MNDSRISENDLPRLHQGVKSLKLLFYIK